MSSWGQLPLEFPFSYEANSPLKSMELLSVKIALQNAADTAIIEVHGEPELCMAGQGFFPVCN